MMGNEIEEGVETKGGEKQNIQIIMEQERDQKSNQTQKNVKKNTPCLIELIQ
jgi:hypothetical protein